MYVPGVLGSYIIMYSACLYVHVLSLYSVYACVVVCMCVYLSILHSNNWILLVVDNRVFQTVGGALGTLKKIEINFVEEHLSVCVWMHASMCVCV